MNSLVYLNTNRCPQLLEILLSVCVKDTTKVNLRQINSVAVAYSSLMFARNNKNSGIQRCITLLAVKGDANDEVRNNHGNVIQYSLYKCHIRYIFFSRRPSDDYLMIWADVIDGVWLLKVAL